MEQDVVESFKNELYFLHNSVLSLRYFSPSKTKRYVVKSLLTNSCPISKENKFPILKDCHQ